MSVRVRPVQAEMMKARISRPLTLRKAATYIGAAALMGCGAEMGAPATPSPASSSALAPVASEATPTASASAGNEKCYPPAPAGCYPCTPLDGEKEAKRILNASGWRLSPYYEEFRIAQVREAIANKTICDDLPDALRIYSSRPVELDAELSKINTSPIRVGVGAGSKIVPGKPSKISIIIQPAEVAHKPIPFDQNLSYFIMFHSKVQKGKNETWVRSPLFPATFKDDVMTSEVKLDKEQLKDYNVRIFYWHSDLGYYLLTERHNLFAAPADKPAQKPETKPTTTTAPAKKTHCSEHPEDCL
ncbi:MAG: hypothetical protein PHG97_05200 [Candidatus Margulisbacteria bacterium]|nr:hypothetical protein [Candidatus Margulisiibacteriota bacterium]